MKTIFIAIANLILAITFFFVSKEVVILVCSEYSVSAQLPLAVVGILTVIWVHKYFARYIGFYIFEEKITGNAPFREWLRKKQSAWEGRNR